MRATPRRHAPLHAALALLLLTAAAACGDEEAAPLENTPRDVYPAGPFGTTKGSTLANLTFTRSDNTPITFNDYFSDPDNTVLLISTAAGWCTACVEEQPRLQHLHTTYSGQGLVVMLAYFEDADTLPGTVELAASWKTQYSLTFDVVADPDGLLSVYYDTASAPMNMVVDLRRMEILNISTGFDESLITSLIEARL